YVVKPDNTVEARDVEVQGTERDQTAIAHGLAAGEGGGTDGGGKLQPRAKGALQGGAKPGPEKRRRGKKSKSFKTFKPPPLSSPARSVGVSSKRFERLEQFERLERAKRRLI